MKYITIRCTEVAHVFPLRNDGDCLCGLTNDCRHPLSDTELGVQTLLTLIANENIQKRTTQNQPTVRRSLTESPTVADILRVLSDEQHSHYVLTTAYIARQCGRSYGYTSQLLNGLQRQGRVRRNPQQHHNQSHTWSIV